MQCSGGVIVCSAHAARLQAGQSLSWINKCAVGWVCTVWTGVWGVLRGVAQVVVTIWPQSDDGVEWDAPGAGEGQGASTLSTSNGRKSGQQVLLMHIHPADAADPHSLLAAGGA